jgi:hypothetical protein
MGVPVTWVVTTESNGRMFSGQFEDPAQAQQSADQLAKNPANVVHGPTLIPGGF